MKHRWRKKYKVGFKGTTNSGFVEVLLNREQAGRSHRIANLAYLLSTNLLATGWHSANSSLSVFTTIKLAVPSEGEGSILRFLELASNGKCTFLVNAERNRWMLKNVSTSMFGRCPYLERLTKWLHRKNIIMLVQIIWSTNATKLNCSRKVRYYTKSRSQARYDKYTRLKQKNTILLAK